MSRRSPPSRAGRDQTGTMSAPATPLVLGAAFLAGSIPFANIAARWTSGIDLRKVGTGTVSGTGLYKVAGFGPLAVAGVFEVAKGSVGPLLAGSEREVLAGIAGGVAVTAHNWSPFLRGAGGRGMSPAMGALLVTAWPGAVLLGTGMGVGRLLHQTALGSFAALLALVPVLSLTHGWNGALAGAAVAIPILAKRLAGNTPPGKPGGDVLVNRLLFDRDTREPQADDDGGRAR